MSTEDAKQKAEWQASFHGLSVYTDESLPKGTVELRDEKGRIIGRINAVQQIRLGTS